MRFVVALIAQLIETSFKVRLVPAQLEGRQYPTIVSAVAAVVEQMKYSSGCQGYAGISSSGAPAIPETRS